MSKTFLFSVNNGTTINKQTVLSSITGNKVNVNVGNNTHLKGALISAGNFTEDGSFVDNKNLNFTTNTLSFENLSNSSYSSNQSLGGNFNYNLDSTKIVDQKEKPQQGGISSVGYNSENSLNVNAFKTLATLGQGNITIKDIENSDEIERLNTDTSKINKDLYSSSTSTSVDATLDTRLLSVKGLNQIKDDYNAATAITNAIEQIVTNDKVGLTDFFSETQKNVDVYNGVKAKIANDEELAKQLQNSDLNPTDKQNMLKELALTVMKELGYVSNDVKLIYTDETGVNNTQVKGYFDDKTNTSYVNDKYNDSTTQLIASLGHEITHDMDKQDKIFVSNDKDQNIYATNFGEDLAFYTNGALNVIKGGSLANTNNHNNGIVTTMPSIFNNSNNRLNSNNQEFTSLDKAGGDDLTVFVHGTFASPKSADKDFLEAVSKTYNEEVYQFDWSGKDGTDGGNSAENTTYARANAAERLTEFVENYQFKEGELLNIVAHSHGGNVVKDFTQFYEGDKKIDNVTFMGTPVRNDYIIDYSKFSNNAIIKNVYDTSDMVQRIGGFDDFSKTFASQKIDDNNVKNIKVESPNYGTIIYPISILNIKEQLLEDHSNLDTKDVWEQFNEK